MNQWINVALAMEYMPGRERYWFSSWVSKWTYKNMGAFYVFDITEIAKRAAKEK